jgi:hypothetical protein
MKYKFTCCLSFAFSAAALGVSLCLICPCLPRILSNRELQFDYIGAIIGVLSLLVTFLLGWNIYSALGIEKNVSDFKKDILKRVINLESRCDIITKKTDEALADMQKKTKTVFEKQGEYIDGCVNVCQALALNEVRLGDKYKLYMSALYHFSIHENDTEDYVNMCLSNMEIALEKAKAVNGFKVDLDNNESFVTAKSGVLRSTIITEMQKQRLINIENRRLTI